MGIMASAQRTLFPELLRLPEGFRYGMDFLCSDEEQALTSTFERLPFREFEFRGFLGKRRTVSFGWRYDFNVRELHPTQTLPTFLLALRAADFAGIAENALQHAMVTEYSAGAAIGWHKDRPEFEDVIGIHWGHHACSASAANRARVGSAHQ
jgi:alkylated DNA repair dioxygenase AlkB